jgi:hypothetical protein
MCSNKEAEVPYYVVLCELVWLFQQFFNPGTHYSAFTLESSPRKPWWDAGD